VSNAVVQKPGEAVSVRASETIGTNAPFIRALKKFGLDQSDRDGRGRVAKERAAATRDPATAAGRQWWETPVDLQAAIIS
jgi:hypothetical protein